MHKPIQILYQGKMRWTAKLPQLVEYVAWSYAGPFISEMIRDGVKREFGLEMSSNSVSNFCRELVKTGRLVKLYRGAFIHVDHAGVFS